MHPLSRVEPENCAARSTFIVVPQSHQVYKKNLFSRCLFGHTLVFWPRAGIRTLAWTGGPGSLCDLLSTRSTFNEGNADTPAMLLQVSAVIFFQRDLLSTREIQARPRRLRRSLR